MADQTIKGVNKILHIYGPIMDADGEPVAEAYFPVACCEII